MAPEITETQDRAQPKCLATRAMSSALALPSTGDDRRRATQVPSDSGSNALTDERGLARTVITTGSLSWSGIVRRAAMNVVRKKGGLKTALYMGRLTCPP